MRLGGRDGEVRLAFACSEDLNAFLDSLATHAPAIVVRRGPTVATSKEREESDGAQDLKGVEEDGGEEPDWVVL